MPEECLHRVKPPINGNGLHSPVLFVLDKGLEMLSAHPLKVSQPLLFQKLQEEPDGRVIELERVGAPVAVIQMGKAVFGKLSSRQASFSKLGRKLLQSLSGKILDSPPDKCETEFRRGGLALTRFYLF